MYFQAQVNEQQRARIKRMIHFLARLRQHPIVIANIVIVIGNIVIVIDNILCDSAASLQLHHLESTGCTFSKLVIANKYSAVHLLQLQYDLTF